jgi:hypothetical protein
VSGVDLTIDLASEPRPVVVPNERFVARRAWRAKIAADFVQLSSSSLLHITLPRVAAIRSTPCR